MYSEDAKLRYSDSFSSSVAPAQYECGKAKFRPKLCAQRIVAGCISNPHSWPWQISLRTRYGHSPLSLCARTLDLLLDVIICGCRILNLILIKKKKKELKDMYYVY